MPGCRRYLNQNLEYGSNSRTHLTYARNLYNQAPRLNRDTIWVNDKNTRKHHTQGSQEVSPFRTSDLKAARNRQDGIIMTKVKHK